MPLVRLGLVLGPLLLLSALILQNQTPKLVLVFLGVRSQPLSLGIWLFIALILGSLTGSLLKFLLTLGSPAPPITGNRRSQPRSQARSQARSPAQARPLRQPASDWQTPPTTEWGQADDWSSTDPQPTPENVDQQRYARARNTSNRQSPVGSKKQPQRSNPPGQRKSVFDAEYRVVTPPGQPPPQASDWEDFEDDFFEPD